jgi:seryl-tRNA synthetase
MMRVKRLRNASSLTLDGFVALDKARREGLVEIEGMRAERNAASAEIGRLRREILGNSR